MNAIPAARARIARTLGLILAFVVTPLVSVTVTAPPAVASSCPVMVNSYISPDAEVPGNLDLCHFSTTSAYGQYAEILPTFTISYSSCSEWSQKIKDWAAAGMPPTGVPALVGATLTRFDSTATVLGRGPTKGTYLVRLGFTPSTIKPNPSNITLRRPVWPGITASQNSRIDTILGQILQHERGHMNIAGQLATAFTEDVPVQAKTTKDALKVALTDPNYAKFQYDLYIQSRNEVQKLYDGVVAHGAQQSVLGGTNIAAFVCPQIDVLTSHLEANASANTTCDGHYEQQVEDTQFLPFQTFNASHTTQDNTGCVGSSVTVPVAGSPAVSGETRMLSAQASSSSIEDTLSGPRSRLEHSESTGSTTFVDLDGLVTMEGSLSCQADRSDSKAAVAGESDPMNSGAWVSYRVTVYATSTVTISLTGSWLYDNQSGGNNASYFKTANPNWAHYFTAADIGTPYVATLAPGSYDFSLYHRCRPYRPPGTFDASESGTLDYTVQILS
jgi:hypothetical protein